MSHQRNRTSHTTRRTAMCAVLAALAVVVLGIGTLIEIMDLSAAIAASAVVLLVFLCYGTRYALLTYAVISVLGILLMPQSLAVWTFAGLLGYYPIIKEKLDRLPCVLAWIVKFLLFAAVLGQFRAQHVQHGGRLIAHRIDAAFFIRHADYAHLLKDGHD